MGVPHGEDSHNQSSGCFKDKLWSWRGVGAASAAEQPVRIFVPVRHSVTSLDNHPVHLGIFSLVLGLQVGNEGGMGGEAESQVH